MRSFLQFPWLLMSSCLPFLFLGKQIPLLPGELHMFNSWNGGFALFPDFLFYSPRNRGVVHQSRGCSIASLLLLTCSIIVSYQYLQKSLCAFLACAVAISCFFAVYLQFCPLLHLSLQHNISFGILVSARLCKPSEILGAAVSPQTFGFVPPQLLKWCC